MFLRSWATVNLNNLTENLNKLHSFTKKGIFSVVKADAYGHDSGIVSRALQDLEFVEKLCVATPTEGKELRDTGITKDILVLGGLLEGEDELFLRYNLIPVISTYESLYLAKQKGIRKIHLKFDTGMSRLGFFPENLEKLKKVLDSFYVEGVMSHFPSADTDAEFTNRQIEIFRYIVQELGSPRHIHIQNSAGITFTCDFCTDVRIGLSMYGEKPTSSFPVELKGVMSIYAKIISVKDVRKGSRVSYCGTFQADRDMKVAVVSFGYADGLPRLLSNRGQLLLDGKRARIIGSITMDMTMIDVSDIIRVKVGDEVVIVGESNSEKNTFTEIAKLSKTIPYEIMCGISKRVVRIPIRG